MIDQTCTMNLPAFGAPAREGCEPRQPLWRGRLARLAGAAAAIATSLSIAAPLQARDWSDLTVSAPATVENLTVYFLHGASAPGPVPLTLGEALRKDQVIVHETGNVERLEIENTGSEAVFVQAGDIVKGGRQDRVLTVSLLIPPRSGRLAIGAYCVEQGRWSQRGGESAKKFASAEAQLPSLEAKRSLYAAKPAPAAPSPRNVPSDRTAHTQALTRPQVQNRVDTLGNVLGRVSQNQARSAQSEIWANVAEVQRKLSSNLATSVKSTLSGSSLQLTLENQKLAETRKKLVAELLPKGTAANDIRGYAFAINGRINSVEVYPSNALFRKMWPKLLRASATEAIAEQDAAKTAAPPPAPADVNAFIDEAANAKSERDDLQAGLSRERRQTKRTLANETRKADGSTVHMSILAR